MSKKPKRRSNHKRDYRAEYRARISRAKERGYSVAIARGHTPKGVIGLSLAAKLGVPVGTEIEDISVREQIPGHPWDLKGDDPKNIRENLPTDLRGIETMSQSEFVTIMRAYGYTFREAFDLFFGY